MVKLVYDAKMKNPKGPYVVVIHANWCGHCKTLMPKFENEIVTSPNFNPELEGLLSLGSVEENDYNKKIFGEVDGYPTIRYIRFSQHGKPLKSFDLPDNIPREPKDIIAWINGVVKSDIHSEVVNKKKHYITSKKQQTMNGGGGKNKRCGKKRTMRKKYTRNKNKTKKYTQ